MAVAMRFIMVSVMASLCIDGRSSECRSVMEEAEKETIGALFIKAPTSL